MTGICGSGIIEVVAEMYLAGVVSTDGVIDGALEGQTSRIKKDGRTWSYVLHEADNPDTSDIVITQTDVRQIQLAKAALYAGIRLLMDEMGVTTVDRIRHLAIDLLRTTPATELHCPNSQALHRPATKDAATGRWADCRIMGWPNSNGQCPYGGALPRDVSDGHQWHFADWGFG